MLYLYMFFPTDILSTQKPTSISGTKQERNVTSPPDAFSRLLKSLKYSKLGSLCPL